MKRAVSTLSRLAFGTIALIAVAVHAQVADPYNYTRTTSYTYDPSTGKLATQTREPSSADACVLASYGYDAYGNVKAQTLQNCALAAQAQKFLSRTSTSDYTAPAAQPITVNGVVQTPGVTYPSGLFATTATNALQQSEHLQVDPRFGVELSQTGPNDLMTTWVVDDFGRKAQRKNVDGTSAVWYYCIVPGNGRDTSSNSPGCPTPPASEVPADTASFVQSESHDVNGTKDGPFTREYQDRAGRTIRIATEGFDGATQPNSLRGATIVQDTVYSPYGTSVLQTQPYFLSTGASTVSGTSNVGVTMTQYDVLGRPKLQFAADPKGQAGSQTFGGGGFGFGAYGSRTAAQTSYAYNGLTTTVTNDKGQRRTEERNAIGETARVTDATGAQVAYQRDAFSNLVTTKDALQNTIAIAYDLVGRKAQLNDPDSGLWLFCYDALGQLTAQQNALMRGSASAGACPTAPNNGATAVANAGWTTFAYDALGRLAQRAEPEYTTTWSFDKYANGSACNMGVGKLCETQTSNGVERRLFYDQFGRDAGRRTDVAGGPSFGSSVAYDVLTGRLATQTYPTGLQVGYGYTALGNLEKVNLMTPATINPLPSTPGGASPLPTSLPGKALLWRSQAVNAWGKIEQEYYGNGLTGRAAFDGETGRPTDLTAGLGSGTAVLSQHYDWDALGHMTGRVDGNGDGTTDANGNPTAVSETFKYEDGLDRLTGYSVSSAGIPGYVRNVVLQYNALGLLLYKSDVGNYVYGAQGPNAPHPHALLSVSGAANTSDRYDADGNLYSSSAGRYNCVGSTSFNLPSGQPGGAADCNVASQVGVQGTEAAYGWLYDENHARLKEVRLADGNTRTLWYLHTDNEGDLSFEQEVDSSPSSISNRHFIQANGQVFAVLVSTGPLPPLASGDAAPSPAAGVNLSRVEYWYRDNVGSVTTTANHLGSVTARYSYDPFGKRRSPNGAYDESDSLLADWDPSKDSGTARGFTGHEHLDDVGLIHMNGRLYDPRLAVFLQADPHITDLGDLQNFARYAYCLNSPLQCADPSGFDDVQQVQVIGNRYNDSGDVAGVSGFYGERSGPQSPQRVVIVGSRPHKAGKVEAMQYLVQAAATAEKYNPCPGRGEIAPAPKNPFDPTKPRTKDYGVPANSQVVTGPVGASFFAPSYADFAAAYKYGQSLASVPAGLDVFGIQIAVGHGGMYDFQRDGNTFRPAFTYGSNYAVGIVMNGAGYSLQSAITIATLFAETMSNNPQDLPLQRLGWTDGWTAAASGSCRR